MDENEARKILKLQPGFSILEMREAYRREIKYQLNTERVQEAFILLSNKKKARVPAGIPEYDIKPQFKQDVECGFYRSVSETDEEKDVRRTLNLNFDGSSICYRFDFL